MVGVGEPVALHGNIAIWPTSMTRVCGACVITGNPGGVLSAEERNWKENSKTEKSIGFYVYWVSETQFSQNVSRGYCFE